eukprot:15445649-Alexandrium_andersonii.AAC.1
MDLCSNEFVCDESKQLLEPLRGGLPPPGPPRLAPQARASSPGGLPPPRTPSIGGGESGGTPEEW